MRLSIHRISLRTTRVVVAWWCVFAMLAMPWLAAAQTIAMATGIEVCSPGSPDGATKRVDADGKPIEAHTHGHECCSTPALAPPPAVPAPSLPTLPPAAPAETLTAAHLGSEWLGPLSRGPPAHS